MPPSTLSSPTLLSSASQLSTDKWANCPSYQLVSLYCSCVHCICACVCQTMLILNLTVCNVVLISFCQDFIEFVYVQSVMLQTRVSLGTLATAALVLLDTSFPVELCVCPAEYTGSSCELCARGYARSNNDSCIECNCNNLSLDCNVETAVCSNCSGNSEGANCERCQSGYYGDPTRDIPCMPCLCPLLDRGFSPTCYLDFDLNATCDACSPGYTGRNCETCMDGFFGNPLVSTYVQSCKPLYMHVHNSCFVQTLTRKIQLYYTSLLVLCTDWLVYYM